MEKSTRGTLRFYSNQLYHCRDYVAGERCGQGKYKHVDGPFYEGEFRNNSQNGHGTYFFKNGSKFIGHWVDDVKCGEGSIFP